MKGRKVASLRKNLTETNDRRRENIKKATQKKQSTHKFPRIKEREGESQGYSGSSKQGRNEKGEQSPQGRETILY